MKYERYAKMHISTLFYLNPDVVQPEMFSLAAVSELYRDTSCGAFRR